MADENPQNGVVLLSDIVGVADAAALTDPNGIGRVKFPKRRRLTASDRIAKQLSDQTH